MSFPVADRRRRAALHLRSTRVPSEEFAGVNEVLIVKHMTDEQLDEYIAFMAERPFRSSLRKNG